MRSPWARRCSGASCVTAPPSKAFYTAIAFEVKRCESTDVDWTCDEMVFFVQDMLFGSITQIGLEKYLQRKFHGKDKEGRVAATKEFVHSVIYRYLASVESGVDYDAAKTLAEKAHIEEVLQCTKLGGKREWKLADFLDEEVWEELGGKAGLREQAIEFLTLIAAGGRTPPINPVCQECGVFKFVHTGDRLNLTLRGCKCDTVSAGAVDPSNVNRKRAREEQPAPEPSFEC